MNVAIYLHLQHAAHRQRLSGIFRHWGVSDQWTPHIYTDERAFRDFLATPGTLSELSGIISTGLSSPQVRQQIAASNIPFVGFEDPDPELFARPTPTVYVHSDYQAIGCAAVETFVRIGRYKSHAFIHDISRAAWSASRAQAFAATLEKRGLACIEYVPSAETSVADLPHLSAFLRSLDKPAAVFAACDSRAADTLRAARHAHLKVPEALSVLGVDNDELYCNHSTPTISSIATDMEEVGAIAARELDKIIQRKRRTSCTILVPIIGVTERESTRPPALSAMLVDRAQAFIRDHATKPLTPADVARFLHTSRRTMDLAFSRHAGETVSETIAACRLKTAKRLLRETKLPVRTVLESSGFSNLDYATRFFRQKTGLTPSDWRKRTRTS